MKNIIHMAGLIFATMAIFFVFTNVNNVARAAIANISKIVFTTKPQEITSINDLSKIISVQAQNSNGDKQVFDDGDGVLTLSSDSSTGQFFSNTSASEEITSLPINNKSWAGRNFYYKDQTLGTYTITASLSANGKSWTATQNITIGESGDTNTNTTSTTTPDTDNSDDANDDDDDSGTLSAHYQQEDLSDYNEPTNVFKLSAGRDRQTYVGSPIALEAKFSVSADLKGKQRFTWSFGDGTTGTGIKHTHIYKYPGEYNVVLNGEAGDDVHAVARAKIKVLAVKVAVNILADGAIEISDAGPAEINLYNWKLSTGQGGFIFPLDTIISANKKVIFPSDLTKINAVNTGVSLFDATGKTVAQISPNGQFTDPNKEISFEEFGRVLKLYKDGYFN